MGIVPLLKVLANAFVDGHMPRYFGDIRHDTADNVRWALRSVEQEYWIILEIGVFLLVVVLVILPLLPADLRACIWSGSPPSVVPTWNHLLRNLLILVSTLAIDPSYGARSRWLCAANLFLLIILFEITISHKRDTRNFSGTTEWFTFWRRRQPAARQAEIRRIANHNMIINARVFHLTEILDHFVQWHMLIWHANKTGVAILRNSRQTTWSRCHRFGRWCCHWHWRCGWHHDRFRVIT